MQMPMIFYQTLIAQFPFATAAGYAGPCPVCEVQAMVSYRSPGDADPTWDLVLEAWVEECHFLCPVCRFTDSELRYSTYSDADWDRGAR